MDAFVNKGSLMKIMWKSLLACIACWGMATTALAGEEVVPLEPIGVSFGEAGVLLIDAQEPYNFFEPTTDVREFADRAEYLKFLEETVNATLVYDEKGEAVGYDIEVETAGDVVYVNPETGAVEPVEDILGLIVGGTEGYVLIGGDAHCVRPEICGYEDLVPLATMEAILAARRVGAQTDWLPDPPFPDPWFWLDEAMDIDGETYPWPGSREYMVYAVRTVDVRPIMPWEGRIVPCESPIGLCIQATPPDNVLRHDVIFYDRPGCDPNARQFRKTNRREDVRRISNEFRFFYYDPLVRFIPQSSWAWHRGVENRHGSTDELYTFTSGYRIVDTCNQWM
jgi:hypothetical protein